MRLRWTRKGWREQARYVLGLLGIMTMGGAVPAAAATLAAAEIAADHVTLRFDDRVAGASTVAGAAPGRLALDVIGLEPGTTVRGVTLRARGGDAARLEVRLPQPAAVTGGRFGADGRSLTLRLGPAVADAVPARLDFFPFSFGGRAAAAPGSVRSVQRVPPPATRLKLPVVRGDSDRPLVVIDAGHGGFDPGAIAPGADGRAGGLREKDVTLKIAKAIRDALVASGRVRVALTREDDRYLVLRERFGIARRLHANLFISIHCDSVGAGDATGASVYTLSEVASDKESARLAARENKADVIAGVDLGIENADVSSILIDLTQRETMNASAGFARLLGREAAPLMPLKPNFHRMASLMVLKAPDMPSVLFETGYISNPKDAEFLDSEEGRDKIAKSVARAVEIHFAKRMATR